VKLFFKLARDQMKNYIKRKWLSGVAWIGCLILASSSVAQEFPAHEVNVIVNYGAGGTTDVATRALAQTMEKILGKSVVVQNKPGALGTLTPAYIARQKPDGYQVGVVTYSTVAIMPHLMDLTYSMKDFEFVAGFGRFRYGIAVNADSPYHTLADLISAAKQGKGLFFGTTSAPNNLAIFELTRLAGANFEHISYKSGGEAVTALLSKQVQVIVQNPPDIMPHVKAGKLRMLASASPMRWPELPAVPTIKEQGFDIEIDSWLGLAVPKGTPAAIVKVLENATLKAMSDPALSDRMTQMGVDPASLSAKEYLEILEKGYVEMGRAIKAAKIPRISG
jgi:tripartite-type tricarboxylate transporter receptor subunit TctC